MLFRSAIRAPWAVGMSVQTRSTVPEATAISMAGADSAGDRMVTFASWGNETYLSRGEFNAAVDAYKFTLKKDYQRDCGDGRSDRVQLFYHLRGLGGGVHVVADGLQQRRAARAGPVWPSLRVKEKKA